MNLNNLTYRSQVIYLVNYPRTLFHNHEMEQVMSMLMSGNLAIKESYQPRLAPGQTAVLSRAGTFVIEDQPYPDCEPNEVIIQLEGCGVCASNIPVWEGRAWFNYPLAAGAPGHEGWGEIVAVGDRVYHLRPGQRVACLATNAFSKYVAVSAQLVAPLPDSLDGMPFPGEAIGCAMNIFRRSDINRDQTVAIIGAGFLGLLLVQLAVDAGARVFVFSRRNSVRALAEKYGAEATFDTEDWLGNANRIRELTNGGCDRVIEMTGLQFALDAGTEMIAEYGKLIIGGYHQDGMRQIDMQKWNWRAIDVINAHERDPRHYIRGIEEGIIAVESGRIRPQELLTHRFDIDQVNDAFQMMIDRPDGFIKGWIQL
jgi:2-desacetyl-2-hydroxyethyl bacteriochlorophyllide A dehydrogenase